MASLEIEIVVVLILCKPFVTLFLTLHFQLCNILYTHVM